MKQCTFTFPTEIISKLTTFHFSKDYLLYGRKFVSLYIKKTFRKVVSVCYVIDFVLWQNVPLNVFFCSSMNMLLDFNRLLKNKYRKFFLIL